MSWWVSLHKLLTSVSYFCDSGLTSSGFCRPPSVLPPSETLTGTDQWVPARWAMGAFRLRVMADVLLVVSQWGQDCFLLPGTWRPADPRHQVPCSKSGMPTQEARPHPRSTAASGGLRAPRGVLCVL